MMRHNAASLWLLGVVAADALLIGAAGLRPKMPLRSDAVVVSLPSLPIVSDAPTVSDEPTAFDEPTVPPPPPKPKQVGMASWYGDDWQGKITASGAPFDERKLTAAHRTLPLNSHVKVTNLQTGRSVEVTITDRGPYLRGRVIDLSEAAAKKLGMVKRGVVRVRIDPEDEGAS